MKSIINTKKGECFLCGRITHTEEHHIFGGQNRKLSEKYGLKIQACPLCHRGDDGVHGHTEKSKDLRHGLKMSGQLAFENYYETKKYKTKEPDYFYDRKPREKFRQLFGVNYL